MPTNEELDVIVPDNNVDYKYKMNSFLVKKGISSALTENPFGTAQGQIVVSASESSIDRDIREGIVKVTETTQTNPAGGVYGVTYTVPADTVSKVGRICVSTNATSPVSINCSIRITTGVVGESTKEFKQFITANKEFKLDFPFVLGTGGKIEFRANTGFGFTGLLICSTIVIEKPLV